MKKMLSTILALALCCLLVTAIADEASPVGTWYIGRAMSNGAEIQVVDPEAIVLTVNEDNTFVLTTAGASASGTWTFGDSAITLVPDPQEGEEEQEPVVYRLEGGELLYDIGATVIHLSRTPAETAALSPAVEAASADEFSGSWKPAAQIVYGLYGPADESGVASLSIEDGKISLLLPGDDGRMAPYGEYEVSFADGVLTAEDTSFGSSRMTLSLHEDGSLYYNVVTDFGTAKLDLTYVYVRGEFEIASAP